MPIFEPRKDELAQLDDGQLEELVARLCEAELSARGGYLRDVKWSGSLTAPDGGVDVRVTVTREGFEGDFVPRADNVFQAKAKRMTRAEILDEMLTEGSPKPVIRELVEKAGSYIIASTEDCSPLTYQRRIDALNEALENLENCDVLHVDYYDCSRLHLWLRQHPGVQIWVREVIGRPLSGWRPFGRWSATPADANDDLILDDGVRVVVPSTSRKPLRLGEAIDSVRRLIDTSQKSVRITGLSGVGKSRFVQALFEDVVGDAPLDRTSVIYADIGDEPEPSARVMIDRMIAQGVSATVVLDNCASDLHNSLASRLANQTNSLRLITVEYDIREDKPQTTEVVQLDAYGPQIAEKLLLRRYPTLGRVNAAKIADFSEGNARLALAIADAAPLDDTIGRLSDEELFNRLFHQRHDLDAGLKEQAEVLSLVYSFSIESDEEGVDELALLGELCEQTRLRMHRAAQTLVDRQVAQKRSRWRAVLPHAVANRLASEALSNIPFDQLIHTFEQKAGARLLKSFGRRLGFLHEHPVAVAFVDRWVSSGGLLSDLSVLNEHGRQLLMHIAPVSPNRALELVEASFASPQVLSALGPRDSFRSIALNILVGLAYYPEFFDRAVAALLLVAEQEDPDNNYDSVRNKLKDLFQLYLSGTHATTAQRAGIVRDLLNSDDETRVQIGAGLLDSALEACRWSSANSFEFGARPRDYGYSPNFDERLEWFRTFIGVAFEASQSNSETALKLGRSVLAGNLRGLWRYPDLRAEIIDISNAMNDKVPWVEGWHAVRSTLYFDYRRVAEENRDEEGAALLASLEEKLAPQDLLSEIEALVVNPGADMWSLDEDFDSDEPSKFEASLTRLSEKARVLGCRCRQSAGMLEEQAHRLFNPGYAPYLLPFGEGLMQCSSDFRSTWETLVEGLKSLDTKSFNYSVLCGALNEISKTDEALTAKLLDEAASDELLRPIIVLLHPQKSFSDQDFERCLAALRDTDNPRGFEVLLWRDEYQDAGSARAEQLASVMVSKEGGKRSLLEGLSMRLHDKEDAEELFGKSLRSLALRAAAKHMLEHDNDPGGNSDYRLTKVLGHCLKYDCEDTALGELLDSLFDPEDGAAMHYYRFDSAVSTIIKYLYGPYLARALLQGEIKDYKRFRAFEGSSHFENPLSGVEPANLVDWCHNAGDASAWGLVAQAISPFGSSRNGEIDSLTEQGLALISASPNPVEVLSIFVDQIAPMSWSGSRANIISQRITALEAISELGISGTAEYLAEVVPNLRKMEHEERNREAQRDRDDEQRFE
ncbi:hypothetical protein [Hoeflea poritis]|uniref:ATP-binding protein n=1 Tax=Hoeflea poritis TaxID=2993659 RepID=A0ABT4VM38_9HYPH|nr:hypothetical protein [Hoeflea poritis]MDA4845744.1 hypothetical protein [Hoeflea poritis]